MAKLILAILFFSSFHAFASPERITGKQAIIEIFDSHQRHMRNGTFDFESPCGLELGTNLHGHVFVSVKTKGPTPDPEVMIKPDSQVTKVKYRRGSITVTTYLLAQGMGMGRLTFLGREPLGDYNLTVEVNGQRTECTYAKLK